MTTPKTSESKDQSSGEQRATGLTDSTAAAQALRRQLVQSMHRDGSRYLFRSDGRFANEQLAYDARAYCWYALAFFTGNAADVALANGMLRQTNTKSYAAGMGHFWCSAIASVVGHFSDRLDGDLRAALLERLSVSLEKESHQRFRGYNDNFPAMAAVTVLVGGRLCGDRKYDEGGLACLRSLKALLSRRGVLSEHSSPTYTPITLTCLAEIAELCDIAEARELATIAEGRIWLDLCAHFFRPTSSIAGPHGRAYCADLCGHFLKAHVCFYQAFGDAIAINPLNTAYANTPGQALHENRADFVQKNIGWQTTPTYHLPAGAETLALHKPASFELRANTEQAAFSRNVWSTDRHPTDPLGEFAAGEINTYTYMTPHYALGTSDRTFLDGLQHSPLHLTFSRQAGVAHSLTDVATLFPRYIIGDRLPDPMRHHLYDDGRSVCVAHKGAAMALYHARPVWSAKPDTPDWNKVPANKLHLAVLLTCFTKSPEEVWLGECRVEDWNAQTNNAVPVLISDHGLYIALHPLIATDLGRPCAVRLERVNGFGMVSLINYEGPARTFSDGELATCLNGVVVDVAAAEDWRTQGGFEAFRRLHAGVCITDTFAAADAMRHVSYGREGLDLEMEISPVSDGIKYALVNGRPPKKPAFEAPGLAPADIAWL